MNSYAVSPPDAFVLFDEPAIYIVFFFLILIDQETINFVDWDIKVYKKNKPSSFFLERKIQSFTVVFLHVTELIILDLSLNPIFTQTPFKEIFEEKKNWIQVYHIDSRYHM